MGTPLSATHTRAVAAAKRNGSTGELSELEPLDNMPTPAWWHKYFKWEENLTVAGKTIEKGWVVPQPLGIALLLVILGGVGGLYWRIIDKQAETDKAATTRYLEQREMLIRLDQRLIDKDTHDREKIQELRDALGSVEAWQQVTNKEIVKLQLQR